MMGNADARRGSRLAPTWLVSGRATAGLGLTLLVLAAVASPAVAPAASSGSPSAAGGLQPANASLSLENVTAEPGDTVSVALTVDGSDVRGYRANVTYDPSAVMIESVDGSAFDDPVSNSDPDRGLLTIAQARAGAVDDPPVVAAELTVRVTGDTGTTLTLSNDTYVNDATEVAREIRLSNGSITVEESDDGDGGPSGIGSGPSGTPGGSGDGPDKTPTDGADADGADTDVADGDGGENETSDGGSADGDEPTPSPEEDDAGGSEAGGDAGDGTPGFGLLAAIAALLAVGRTRSR